VVIRKKASGKSKKSKQGTSVGFLRGDDSEFTLSDAYRTKSDSTSFDGGGGGSMSTSWNPMAKVAGLLVKKKKKRNCVM
jgi:hypothetical protein